MKHKGRLLLALLATALILFNLLHVWQVPNSFGRASSQASSWLGRLSWQAQPPAAAADPDGPNADTDTYDGTNRIEIIDNSTQVDAAGAGDGAGDVVVAAGVLPGGADTELLCVDRRADCIAADCSTPDVHDFLCKATCGSCSSLQAAMQSDLPLQVRIVQSLSRCMDLHPRCGAWQLQGKCDSEPQAMLQLCQLACGFCTDARSGPQPPELLPDGAPRGAIAAPPPLPPPCSDDVSVCPFLAKAGMCDSDSHWVSQQCGLSCGSCDAAPPAPLTLQLLHTLREAADPEACLDYHTECGSWKDSGICRTNTGFMRLHCKRSCGLCSPPPPGGAGGGRVDVEAQRREAAEKQRQELMGAGGGPERVNRLAQARAAHLATAGPLVKVWGRETDGGGFSAHAMQQLAVPGCADSDPNCPDWGAKGECAANPAFMHSGCRATCGTCGMYKLRKVLRELKLPQHAGGAAAAARGPAAAATLQGIPAVGFGTAGLGDKTRQAVVDALAAGYRMLDSAESPDWYREDEVGAAIEASGVPRHQLFLTSKIHPRDLGASRTKAAAQRSLKKLRTSYHDLLLLHYPDCFPGAGPDCPNRPGEDWRSSWRALEELVNEGLVRYIGVSNFNADQMQQLLGLAKVAPSVLEAHSDPLAPNTALLNLCLQRGIVFIAYSSLGTQWLRSSSQNPVLTNPVILEEAAHLGRSPAQLVLMWALSRGMVVVPRSANAAHIGQNLDVFDTSLSAAVLRRIAALDTTQPKPGA